MFKKYLEKWKWFNDPIFWRRMFITLIISNIILFISWLISMLTINACMKVLDTLNKLLGGN